MPRRCVIIGNDRSLFPRQLAAAWRHRGLDPVIVTDRAGAAGVLPDGTRVLSTHEASGAPADGRELWTARILERVRSICVVVERSRARRARGSEAGEPASFVPPLAHARRVARLAESVEPEFVFGQEAFAYGPATAACRGVPRILMPWGGDV